MSAIRLLSFDLDDTLWPCRPTILAAEEKLYRWLKTNVAEITQRLSIEDIRQKRSEFLELHPEIEHDLSVLRVESLRALAREFDIDDDWVMPAFQVFYSARQEVTLYGDVADVLDDLKKTYRLVSVSNGNADIHKTGVGHWFEFAVSAADVGFMKPHPAVFKTLLERSRCSSDEVLHIGDHPHHDVFAANQAGIRTVWVNRCGEEWDIQNFQADYHIQDMHELVKILEDLPA